MGVLKSFPAGTLKKPLHLLYDDHYYSVLYTYYNQPAILKATMAELLPFREKIQRIVDAEWNLRYTKKLNRFIKKATLKYPAADLDDTIYHPERRLDAHIIEKLSKCEWIEQG